MFAIITVLLIAAGPAETHAAQAQDSLLTFAQIARPHPRSNGAPQAADVCFSTRWPNPGKRDSFKAAREFHATRWDWFYMSGKPEFDKQFVARAKARGYPIAGTLNCQLVDSPVGAARTFSQARTVNMKGEPLKDPWTQKYGGRFGCPNNPEYAKIYLAHARYDLDAGVAQFQMDGPQLNDLMSRYGGCFCTHCVTGFREYLGSHSSPEQRAKWGIADLATFDYAHFLLDLGVSADAPISRWKGPKELRERFLEFQIESGLRFLAAMQKQINQMAGRKLAYSCNATDEFVSTYSKVFDFAENEAYPPKEGQPAFLYQERLKKAQEIGKSMLFTFVSHDVPHNRRFMASTYALGANAIVPWDVFTGLSAPRFYGTPEQFADLCGFIRANRLLLDGYDEAGVFGPTIHEARYPDGQPPLQVQAAAPVLAVVRAQPGKADAPVVVHLVTATSDPTGPLRVTFDPRRFFGARALKMRFIAPPPYVAAAHETAEASGDFTPLSKAVALPGGRVSAVDLPAVDPWGILVVEPDDAADNSPWQPAVWCDEKSRLDESLLVRLDCATPGAVIRYTLDGDQPSSESPIYTKALRLDATTTVKALSCNSDAATSPVVSVRFERLKPAPRLAPDAPALKPNLKLWLNADSLAATHKDGSPVNRWPAIVGPGAAVPAQILLSGAAAKSPIFSATGINGRPGLQFDGDDDQLSVPHFANSCLAAKPFTTFLVTQSADPSFGIAGNAANGSGGIPRLYLTRGAFNYDRLAESLSLGVAPGVPVVTVYQHDGQKTAAARCGGRLTGKRNDLPVVKTFGSGGNLGIPLWTGHTNHAGVLGEIVAYDRRLTDAEVEAVEEHLSLRYGISDRPRWTYTPPTPISSGASRP